MGVEREGRLIEYFCEKRNGEKRRVTVNGVHV